MNAQRIKIVDGPGIQDCILCCFNRRSVTFKLEKPLPEGAPGKPSDMTLTMSDVGFQRKRGGGGTFLIRTQSLSKGNLSSWFEGEYDPQTRKGCLEIKHPQPEIKTGSEISLPLFWIPRPEKLGIAVQVVEQESPKATITLVQFGEELLCGVSVEEEPPVREHRTTLELYDPGRAENIVVQRDVTASFQNKQVLVRISRDEVAKAREQCGRPLVRLRTAKHFWPTQHP
jgi:hypothetical protein